MIATYVIRVGGFFYLFLFLLLYGYEMRYGRLTLLLPYFQKNAF